MCLIKRCCGIGGDIQKEVIQFIFERAHANVQADLRVMQDVCGVASPRLQIVGLLSIYKTRYMVRSVLWLHSPSHRCILFDNVILLSRNSICDAYS